MQFFLFDIYGKNREHIYYFSNPKTIYMLSIFNDFLFRINTLHIFQQIIIIDNFLQFLNCYFFLDHQF